MKHSTYWLIQEHQVKPVIDSYEEDLIAEGMTPKQAAAARKSVEDFLLSKSVKHHGVIFYPKSYEEKVNGGGTDK